MPSLQIGIFVNTLFAGVITTVSLLVPWCTFLYTANATYWPISVPVEVGLTRCFGDTCRLRELAKGVPPIPNGGGGPLPTWGPPPVAVPDSGGAAGGAGAGGVSPGGGYAGSYGGPPAAAAPAASHASGLPSPDSPAFPFFVAAVTAICLFALACALALVASGYEAARMRGRVSPRGQLPVGMTMWSSVCLLLAPLLYVAITAGPLNGGEYRVGLWVAFGGGVASVLVAFVTWLYADTAAAGYRTIGGGGGGGGGSVQQGALPSVVAVRYDGGGGGGGASAGGGKIAVLL
ncbi:unnamed protein product [Phaeothamnion confervicola]